MSTATVTPQKVRREDGFTLPELLVAVTIMILLTGTLGFTIVSTLRVIGDAQDRVGTSKDVSLVGYVFPRDVGNASVVTSGSSLTAPCGTGTPLVTMKTGNVRTTGSAASDQNIWYGVTSGGALNRYECQGSAVVNTTTLADKVSATTVACQKQLTASPWFATAVPCSSSTMPSRVVFTLTVASPTAGAQAPRDPAQSLTLYGVLQ